MGGSSRVVGDNFTLQRTMSDESDTATSANSASEAEVEESEKLKCQANELFNGVVPALDLAIRSYYHPQSELAF